jgi:hypothetical protein
MKKCILILVLSLVLAVAWGGYVLGQTENPAGDLMAMLQNPPPGFYVSGWPAFTISYPKDWEVQTPFITEVFRVAAPRPSLPPSPVLGISIGPVPLPLDKLTTWLVPALAQFGKDIKVVSDKPTQLKDGTPAQEAEFEWVIPNGPKLNSLYLVTTKDDLWIFAAIHDDKGKIGEDLKSILYSLRLQPGKEELVKLPPDVEQFLKEFGSDMASRNLEKVMTHFSDRFLNYGRTKQIATGVWAQALKGIPPGVTFFEPSVTRFALQGDKAYVAGFWTHNLGKQPIMIYFMIKEDGQWKWYGNQK